MNTKFKISGIVFFLMIISHINIIPANAQKGRPSYPYQMVFFESTWQDMANYEKKGSGPKLTGQRVLNEDFIKSNIILKNDTVVYKDVPVRVNVYENALEVKYKGEIKYLPVHKIEKVEFQNQGFSYLTNNTINTDAPEGFYKILYKKQSVLLCHYGYKIKEANYNVQMDVGEKDDKIIVTKDYYVVLNNQLIKLENNRRKLIKQLGNSEAIEDFIKKQKINPKDEQDMIKFLDYYDSAKINCFNS